MIEGSNEEFQTLGVAVMVERGAPRPFEPEVVSAVTAFCEALTARVPVHPDCVVAMGEIPYTRDHPANDDEIALAAAARERVKIPETDGRATITKKNGETIDITYETRATSNGRRIGMMMRKRFDGKQRGMLFIYPWRASRWFWMRNCFVEIDLAYIREGRIEQILTMKPEAGTKPSEIPHYESNAAVRYALEMPGGWFESHGVRKGDAVEIQ